MVQGAVRSLEYEKDGSLETVELLAHAAQGFGDVGIARSGWSAGTRSSNEK